MRSENYDDLELLDEALCLDKESLTYQLAYRLESVLTTENLNSCTEDLEADIEELEYQIDNLQEKLANLDERRIKHLIQKATESLKPLLAMIY